MPIDFHFEDILIRTLLAFCLLLLSARLLGKQMIAQMSYFDFVTNITLGSLTGAIILDHNITLDDLLLAITTFTMISFLTSFGALKNQRWRRLTAGLSVELIRDGQILEKEMERVRVRMDSLAQQLRIKNVFDIATVKQAFLEPNGELSVLLKAEARPLTFGDVYQGRQIADHPPVELIMDGTVLTDNLVRNQFDLAWLMQQLDKNGVADTKDVAYAVLTSRNELYIDTYRDSLQTQVQERQ